MSHALAGLAAVIEARDHRGGAPAASAGLLYRPRGGYLSALRSGHVSLLLVIRLIFGRRINMQVLKSTLFVVAATLLLSFSMLGLSNGFSISTDTRSMLLLAMAAAGLVFGGFAVKELAVLNRRLTGVR
ncbi:MAG TPA: hypothetical protein VGH71_08685 [Gammaproteobacteria bacterium]|jgi:hypothetical protein